MQGGGTIPPHQEKLRLADANLSFSILPREGGGKFIIKRSTDMTDVTPDEPREGGDGCSAILRRMREKDLSARAVPEEDLVPACTLTDQVAAALLELMRQSDSDSVRVAAAKALMDSKLHHDAGEDEAEQREEEEREAALAEASKILAEFAETKIALAAAISRTPADACADVVSSSGAVDTGGAS